MMNAPADHPSVPEHPLLAVAHEMAPRISARAEELETARRVPADLARELARAGFFRLALPEAYGGFEVHPVQFVSILEELGRADGSTGWCVMISAATGVTAAWLSDSAARTLFGAPDAIAGGVSAPMGRAEVVPGGYRVTGRWPWASHGHNCDWLVGAAVVTEGGQPRLVREGVPQTRLLCFPARDVTLHDTWDAMGLCGTGSGEMEVKELFVPAEFSFTFAEPPRLRHPLYVYPLGLLGMGIPAVALGITRRAIDEFKALAHQKLLLPGRLPLATRPAVQEAVAEAEATWRASRCLLREALHGLFAAASSGDVAERTRIDLRLAMTHATRSAAGVVSRLYEAAGSSTVPRTSPLQRCFRDIHVITQHLSVYPYTLEVCGSVLLGVPVDTSRF